MLNVFMDLALEFFRQQNALEWIFGQVRIVGQRLQQIQSPLTEYLLLKLILKK